MLSLFENVTSALTDLEKNKLVPLLISLLEKTNKDNRLTGSRICNHFRAQGIELSEARLRKMISYIRQCNLTAPKALIGAWNGYFITSDLSIIDDQVKSLEGRIDSLKAVVDALKSQRINLIKKHI